MGNNTFVDSPASSGGSGTYSFSIALPIEGDWLIVAHALIASESITLAREISVWPENSLTSSSTQLEDDLLWTTAALGGLMFVVTVAVWTWLRRQRAELVIPLTEYASKRYTEHSKSHLSDRGADVHLPLRLPPHCDGGRGSGRAHHPTPELLLRPVCDLHHRSECHVDFHLECIYLLDKNAREIGLALLQL